LGLFNRGPQTAVAPPLQRRIGKLNPAYFADIDREIQGFGGTDSIEDVAYGVANAIENTAHKLLGDEPWKARRFDNESSVATLPASSTRPI